MTRCIHYTDVLMLLMQISAFTVIYPSVVVGLQCVTLCSVELTVISCMPTQPLCVYCQCLYVTRQLWQCYSITV